jgi:hypothetical protein
MEREEKYRLSNMTKEEKEAIELKKIQEEKHSENEIKNYMMKKKELFADNSGYSKKKFNKPCKHQYIHGKFCTKSGSSDDCPKELNCGCWPHKTLKGMCSFIHDDELEEMKVLFDKFKVSEGKFLYFEGVVDDKPIYSLGKTPW